MTMQMGRTLEGDPDIVNFSDARRNVFPGWVSQVGEITGNPVGAHTADYAGHPYFFYDFLWQSAQRGKGSAFRFLTSTIATPTTGSFVGPAGMRRMPF